MQTGSQQHIEASKPEFVERGTVAWFDDAKGYGFIKRDDGGRDAYVHFTDIVFWTRLDADDNRKRLEKNERVEFEVVHGDRGRPAAKSVRVCRE